MRSRVVSSIVALWCAAWMSACGSAATAEATAATETSGGELAGPPPSYLAEGSRVVARVDMARVRRSPVAEDVESAIETTSMWQSLAEGTGIHPVTDLDAAVVASDALYADRRVAVLRYTGTEAELRDRLLRVAASRQLQATWSEVDGFAVASLPVALPVPHSLVLTASHEAVVCPTDDVARVVGIAANHRARRAGGADGEATLEPQLAFAPGEVATAVVSDPIAPRPGYPTPPVSFRIHAMEDDASHYVFVYVHAEFATEADAQTALDWTLRLARQYAGEFIVRGAGLSRPLEQLAGTRSGTAVDLQTNLTPDEVRRGLGAAALLQMMQSRQAR